MCSRRFGFYSQSHYSPVKWNSVFLFPISYTYHCLRMWEPAKNSLLCPLNGCCAYRLSGTLGFPLSPGSMAGSSTFLYKFLWVRNGTQMVSRGPASASHGSFTTGSIRTCKVFARAEVGRTELLTWHISRGYLWETTVFPSLCMLYLKLCKCYWLKLKL